MIEELVEIELKKILGPSETGAAVLLGNSDKTFVVFIGATEAEALTRALRQERLARPMTHELIDSLFLGFGIKIKCLNICSIIDNAFCATLILEQKIEEEDGVWKGRSNEVRIDARPSDCLVLASRNQIPIHVTKTVFDAVQDVSHLAQTDLALPNLSGEIEGEFPPWPDPDEPLLPDEEI